MIIPILEFSLKDCIEILFFSSLFYYVTRWLSKDRQKNLVLYFYGYCLISIGSYYAGLSTITLLLFWGFGPTLMLFMMMHEDLLQRNLIALHSITVTKTNTGSRDWHEIFARSCLVLLHKQQHVLCVIEQQDSLKHFVDTPFELNTPLQQGLLESLMHQPQDNKNSFVLLTSSGIIKSIESTWVQHKATLEIQHTIPRWQQEALLFSAKTDALILYGHPTSKTFSFVAQGKHLDELTADQIVRILHKYAKKPISPSGVKPHAERIQESQTQYPHS